MKEQCNVGNNVPKAASVLIGIGLYVISAALFCFGQSTSPPPDYFHSPLVRKILQEEIGYEYLKELTTFGPRMNGTLQQERAIQWAKKKLEEIGCDRVYLQPVSVPHWSRGSLESAVASVATTKEEKHLTIAALGGSVGTPQEGITAEVIEVADLQGLAALGEKLSGKIVFYNKRMDKGKTNLFEAYSELSRVRIYGATSAALYGAVGMLIRSITTKPDNLPHVGLTFYYDKTVPKIPAAALGWQDAEWLSRQLHNNQSVRLTLKLGCTPLPSVVSYNVIGEIKGTEFPQEIILVSGHLDSWDKGDAVHDDGVGCCQALEVLYHFKHQGIQPKRTIRCVLFVDEEMRLTGAKTYAKESGRAKERHLIALESDRGGFAPRGFLIEADSAIVPKIQQLLQPAFQNVMWCYPGYTVGDLSYMESALIRIEYVPDDSRYFDLQHSDHDVFSEVNPREMTQGSAAITFLVYLMDQNWKN